MISSLDHRALLRAVDGDSESRAIVLGWLREAFAPLVAAGAAPAEELPQPLADILECSTAAALRREERVEGLQALSVGLRGRRRLYLASSVRRHLAGVK